MFYELGVDYQGDGWLLKGMVFENDVCDLIQIVCVVCCGVCGGEICNYENVDRVWICGFELGGGVDLLVDLCWEFNYIYFDVCNCIVGQCFGDCFWYFVNS